MSVPSKLSLRRAMSKRFGVSPLRGATRCYSRRANEKTPRAISPLSSFSVYLCRSRSWYFDFYTEPAFVASPPRFLRSDNERFMKERVGVIAKIDLSIFIRRNSSISTLARVTYTQTHIQAYTPIYFSSSVKLFLAFFFSLSFFLFHFFLSFFFPPFFFLLHC